MWTLYIVRFRHVSNFVVHFSLPIEQLRCSDLPHDKELRWHCYKSCIYQTSDEWTCATFQVKRTETLELLGKVPFAICLCSLYLSFVWDSIRNTTRTDKRNKPNSRVHHLYLSVVLLVLSIWIRRVSVEIMPENSGDHYGKDSDCRKL